MVRINLIRPICVYCKSTGWRYAYDDSFRCAMCKGTGHYQYYPPRRWINKWWKVIW